MLPIPHLDWCNPNKPTACTTHNNHVLSMTDWSGLADLVEKVLHGAQGLSIGQGNKCTSHSKFCTKSNASEQRCTVQRPCAPSSTTALQKFGKLLPWTIKKMLLQHSVPHEFVTQRGSATLTRLARLQYGLPRSRLKDCSIALDSYRTPERCHCPRHRCSTHGSSPDIRTKLMYEIKKHLLASNHDNVGFQGPRKSASCRHCKVVHCSSKVTVRKGISIGVHLPFEPRPKKSTTSLKTPR